MRIVIAEDGAPLREGLALLLRAESLDVVATADGPEAFLAAVDEHRPDAGLDRLSVRAREVLALMAEGLDNTAIAARLEVTDGAVHEHIRSIVAKLDLPPTDAARPAGDRGAALPGRRPPLSYDPCATDLGAGPDAPSPRVAHSHDWLLL